MNYGKHTTYNTSVCFVDPFVLSVCPEIKLRIPSLAVCLYVNV